MPSITLVMLAMRCELSAISAIIPTISCITSPPLLAAWLVRAESVFTSPAVSVLLFTVAVISFMVAAVCCTLAAACSVRRLSSLLLLAMASLALRTLIACPLTSSTSQRNIRPSWPIARCVIPTSSTRSICSTL